MDKKIVILREQLSKLIVSFGIDSPEVLSLSQQLDTLIIEYYRRMINNVA